MFLEQASPVKTHTGSHINYGHSRQLTQLIFGMQPYINPTRMNMEDDLDIFKMEDDLIFFEDVRRPQFLLTGRIIFLKM